MVLLTETSVGIDGIALPKHATDGVIWFITLLAVQSVNGLDNRTVKFPQQQVCRLADNGILRQRNISLLAHFYQSVVTLFQFIQIMIVGKVEAIAQINNGPDYSRFLY